MQPFISWYSNKVADIIVKAVLKVAQWSHLEQNWATPRSFLLLASEIASMDYSENSSFYKGSI